MKDRKLLYGTLVVVVLAIGGCGLFVSKQPIISPPMTPDEFNLIFEYGVGAKNELNTFQGRYTKDMIVDTPITVNLSLSKEELDRIYQKMVEIGFFDYPDKFAISVPSGEIVGGVTPYHSYYFKVEYNSKIKELSWEDEITNKDERADRLRELIKLIIDVIESKEEYKKLPSPTGGYL